MAAGRLCIIISIRAEMQATSATRGGGEGWRRDFLMDFWQDGLSLNSQRFGLIMEGLRFHRINKDTHHKCILLFILHTWFEEPVHPLFQMELEHYEF